MVITLNSLLGRLPSSNLLNSTLVFYLGLVSMVGRLSVWLLGLAL